MKHLFNITAIAIAIAFALTACHTSKTTTQVVTNSVHDTLIMNRLLYDSIYIDNLHYVDRARDTVLIRDRTTEYRYRILRDTIYKSVTDSIPVIKEVTITKTERYIPNIYKWSLAICITLIIISIIYIVWKIKF